MTVKFAGPLVGKNRRGIADDGAGDSPPLLFFMTFVTPGWTGEGGILALILPLFSYSIFRV
jgi:hypothetical protein